METSALSQLSEEQLAVLNDELKAVYCSLTEADQKFFANTFKPKDLPTILSKKAEIMKRNQADQERVERLKTSLAQAAAASPTSETTNDILTAAAGTLGIGAAAVMVATDNTAFYQGVNPSDLVSPLRTEFQSDTTALTSTGSPNALTVTVLMISGSQRVPAMTINLTAKDDGTEVKVNDLSAQGVLEAIKSGGEKLLDIAGKGIHLLTHKSSTSPEEILSSASQTLDSGADLAEVMHNLKLKDRAWKVIKQTAESIEENYRDQKEKELQARLALEKAWDNYYNCPTCGVSFDVEETLCHVCGTGRPDKPMKADPRKL